MIMAWKWMLNTCWLHIMIAGWNFKTTVTLKVKNKNLSNWFVLLVRRTLHVSQLLLHRVCQVSAKIYDHGHGSHGGHCRCVKGCQVHTLLFFQQQPYFQIGGTLFPGLQHSPLTHSTWPLSTGIAVPYLTLLVVAIYFSLHIIAVVIRKVSHLLFSLALVDQNSGPTDYVSGPGQHWVQVMYCDSCLYCCSMLSLCDLCFYPTQSDHCLA